MNEKYTPKQITFNTQEELQAFYGFCDIVLKAHGMAAKNNVDFFLNKIQDVSENVDDTGE